MAKLQIMVFEIEGNQYGIELQYVSGIYKASICEVTPLPNCSHIVKGITNVRGKIYPVIDLKRKFGYADAPNHPDTKFIVMKVNDQEIGCFVDEVSDILTPDENLVTDASHLAMVNSDAFSHIIKTKDHIIIVLQIDLILLNDEIEHIEIVRQSIETLDMSAHSE